jgi:hypothetical protein
LVGAVHRRQAVHRPALTISPDEERAQDEHRRAALTYLIWPAALYEHYAAREPASAWYRGQIAQAMRFGTRWVAIAFAALLWPLLVSLLLSNPTVTIVIYVVALAADCVLFVVWLRAALRYSKLAARGETFALKR